MKLHRKTIGSLFAMAAIMSMGFGPAAAKAPDEVEATWVQQTPLPTGNTLIGADMLPTTEGWAVGETGTIVHTPDGGQNWNKQRAGSTEGLSTLNAVDFFDALHGVAVGNDFVYTTDGGQHWLRGSGPAGTKYSVAMADATTAFAADGFPYLYKTTNGGQTWSVVRMPIAMGSVQFFAPLNGVASGPNGLLHTTDGGRTWIRTIGAHHGGFFINHDEGWYVQYNRAEHTTDGGNTWERQMLPLNAWVYDAIFTDSNNGWAISGSSTILHTTNGGDSWTQQAVFDAALERLAFADALHGMVVGNGGVIFSTSDSGVTWVDRQNGSGEWANGIDAVDRDHAWAATGGAMYTTNGGAVWTDVTVTQSPAVFYGIDFVDTARGWLVGEQNDTVNDGVVYGSTDGGQTWQQQWLGAADTILEDVKAVDAQTAVAVGFNQVIVRTTNGGSEWNFVSSPPATDVLNGVDFVGQVGWAVGNEGTALKTTDAGATWSASHISGAFYLQDVSFADGNTGWTVGFNEDLYRTTNGGQTWTRQNTPLPAWFTFLAVQAISPTEAWVAGGEGALAHTTNGGQTWVVVRLPVNRLNAFTALAFVDANYGWTGGTTYEPNGGIWLYR